MKKPLLHHLSDYFFPHPRNNHRPHLFSTASIAALALAVIILEAGFLVQTKFMFFTTDFLASVLPGALVVLTNQDRASLGLAGVTESAVLDAAAEAAAADMAANGYFSHVSPSGKTPWHWLDEAGYHYRYAGQNLAVNFTDSVNVETAWMESPTHRANIVKREYTEVGFGTAQGVYEGQETTFVVEFFAAPATVETPIAVEKVRLSREGQTFSTATATATAPVQVLGTEIKNADDIGSTAAPVAEPGLVARLLTAPQSTLLAILTALFAVISISCTIAILMRGKAQHRSVVLGGAFLLLFIPAVMLVSVFLSGPIVLNADAGATSVLR
ncbi:MAG: CAP domain-containing protein [Candidatus Pacebacteria bacterium]|nr:CAP domain-containing protein [Candidatus Paceibacterota bacterium]